MIRVTAEIAIESYCKLNLHLGDLSAFVVTSQDGNSVGESHLKGDKEGDSLDGVVSAIDVVTHEQVVGVGGLASNLEKLAQVMELTVDVAADCHGGAHLLHVRLVDQDLFCL